MRNIFISIFVGYLEYFELYFRTTSFEIKKNLNIIHYIINY